MRRVVRALSLPSILLGALIAAPGHAQNVVSDVRLGVLAHDIGVLGEHHEDGADINGEMIFASPVPDDWLSDIGPRWRWIFRPQPNAGFDANTNGNTSQLYFGLTWTVDLDNGGWLWPDHAVFFAISFGPAFNTGHVHSTDPGKLSIGSNVLFHPAIELGYRITPQWSVSAYFEHSSNAGLANDNPGLNNAGLRVGLHF